MDNNQEEQFTNAVNVSGVFAREGMSMDEMLYLFAMDNHMGKTEVFAGTAEEVQEWTRGARAACEAFREDMSRFIVKMNADTSSQPELFCKGVQAFIHSCHSLL